MAAKCKVGELTPGALITGIPDFPLVIYRIVDYENVGVGVEVQLCNVQGRLLINEKTGFLRMVNRFEDCIALDPKDQWKQNTNDINGETGEKTMNKFDSSEAKDNVMSAAINMKNTALQVKTGQIVISTIKSSIKATPGVPEAVKAMLDTPYADMVIGATLAVIVPMVSNSATIISASQAAGVVGAVAVADKITIVEMIIEKALGMIPLALGKIGGAIEPAAEVTSDK